MYMPLSSTLFFLKSLQSIGALFVSFVINTYVTTMHNNVIESCVDEVFIDLEYSRKFGQTIWTMKNLSFPSLKG